MREGHEKRERQSHESEKQNGRTPVDRPTYDRTIEILGKALNGAKVDRSEKVRAFKRLANLDQADLPQP